MTPAITLWTSFVIACGVVAWFGNRKQAAAFTIIALATFFGAKWTLGHPSDAALPSGEHTVLGARIDKDVAIFVLIDRQPHPRYYQMPYSESAARQLQRAMDATADGEGSVSMKVGEDGSSGFSEKTPPPEPPKQAERALLQ